MCYKRPAVTALIALKYDLIIPLHPSSPRCSLWIEYPFEGLDEIVCIWNRSGPGDFVIRDDREDHYG